MESFEEVYQKYLKEVYCFLLRLSGDREIAEELTQQTFAIAFEKLENFRGECKLSVWLCQIAKHEYYAWTKKQKRYANKLDENHVDQGEDLLNGIINQENGQIIRKILHDLQEPYKEVFMLRVMERYHTEISDSYFQKVKAGESDLLQSKENDCRKDGRRRQ